MKNVMILLVMLTPMIGIMVYSDLTGTKWPELPVFIKGVTWIFALGSCIQELRLLYILLIKGERPE